VCPFCDCRLLLLDLMINCHLFSIIPLKTTMPILTSCLERDAAGGDRCNECKRFEDEVKRKVSKIKDKKRGGLCKAYRCSAKKDMDSCPDILRRREALTVRGHSVKETPSPLHSPKQTRRSKDSGALSYKVPTSDEFKRRKTE
jgi:hypothetical protein